MRYHPLLCLAATALYAACSSSSDNTPATAGSAGTAGSPSGGDGGGAGDKVEGTSGSENSGGAAGSAGGAAGSSSAGAAGTGGAAADAAAGAAGSLLDAGADGAKADGGQPSYTCTLVIGLLVTAEWYAAGFEQVVKDQNWEIKAAHYAYTTEWANPTSTFWATPISSPCTAHADTPDRIIYVALDWDYTTEKQWEDDVTKDVAVIKMKYPSAQNIELLSVVRCPLSCGTPPARPAETCYVAPITDQALAAVAAKTPNVTVGPKFEDDTCADFPNLGTHMTTAATMATGKKIGDYYATH